MGTTHSTPHLLNSSTMSGHHLSVAEISSKESRIDLLINNAGTASTKVEVETGDKSVDEFSKTLFDAPMEDWDNTYRTNVFALYYVAAAFLPLLVKANKPDEMHKNAKNWNPHKEELPRWEAELQTKVTEL